jgi:hypothetical protein
MKSWAVVLGGLGASFIVACANADDSKPTSMMQAPKLDLDADCYADGECASQLCLEVSGFQGKRSICSQPCEKDADCSGRLPVCGTGPDGSRVCAYGCESDAFHYGFVCVAGRPIACGAVEGQCEGCGCSNSQRCDIGGSCVDKSDVGGVCRTDSDCKTLNCSRNAGVCRVTLGATCTNENCDRCLTPDTGSYCDRNCTSGDDCNGGLCLVTFGSSEGVCRQRCSEYGDPSCGGLCVKVSNGDELYCKL